MPSPRCYPFMNDTRAESGGANNPEGKNQHSEVKCDNITLDQPKPDKPPTGNSTSYAFRRLRNHPETIRKLLVNEPNLLARFNHAMNGEAKPHGGDRKSEKERQNQASNGSLMYGNIAELNWWHMPEISCH